MRYWDSSALIPLFVQEEDTACRQSHLNEDPQIVTWWGSKVECASAFNRLFREGTLSQNEFELIKNRLDQFASTWIETQATEKLRQRALRLLSVHTLRAADALQLAAALIASEECPQTLSFLCSDARLISAAKKEDFRVLS